MISIQSSKLIYFISLIILLLFIKKIRCDQLLICPTDTIECDCDIDEGELTLDCSSKSLSIAPNLGGAEHVAHTLDLSNNQLNEFPQFTTKLPFLTLLDLSRNHLKNIPTNSLNNLQNLRFLYLNQNNISNWIDINPNTFLQYASNLETLSLSGNHLTSLSTADQSYILASASLKLLDLSDCKITKVYGQFVLQGLPKLEHLILSGNPLRTITEIHSDSLLSIDLSNCKLTYLQPTVFHHLISLTYVNLAQNHRLSLTKRTDEYVSSETVKRIDLSLCNMDGIEISGFPNLMTAILRGNLIKQIKRDSFNNNIVLENIDLSSNAITHISSTSFRDLKLLKHLDLSFNMIRRIERETFKDNDVLTSINLSRNYIERFNRISAYSLTHLNMSWCEILKIDLDAFNDMPELVELDMSNNLFSDFPPTLQSNTLQLLDLSMCRISKIGNNTFQGFPELTHLNLAGNRFTTPFNVEYFDDNTYLRDIWLGDNPWRCDCTTKGFYEFFQYLLNYPQKINDHIHLRCNSPEEKFGSTWDVACSSEWFQSRSQQLGTAQKVWTFLMVGIVVFCCLICVIMSIRRCMASHKEARREEQRMHQLEEARERLRVNRVILNQEAQLNAPDPRESRPPCYEDAILLPRLNGSFASLRAKIKEDEDGTDEPDNLMSRRNRSRSEEVLSQRDSVADQNRQTRRQIIAEANNRISTLPILEIPPRNLEIRHTSAEARNRQRNILTITPSEIPQDPVLMPNRNTAPATSQQRRNNDSSSNDSSEISINNNNSTSGSSTNSSFSDAGEAIKIFDNKRASPYAQRKSAQLPAVLPPPPRFSKINIPGVGMPLVARNPAVAATTTTSSSSSSSTGRPSSGNIGTASAEIHIVDDHYGRRSISDSSSSLDSETQFTVIKK